MTHCLTVIMDAPNDQRRYRALCGLWGADKKAYIDLTRYTSERVTCEACRNELLGETSVTK